MRHAIEWNVLKNELQGFPFREICSFPWITEPALKLHINSQSLSRSESCNFSTCVTNFLM